MSEVTDYQDEQQRQREEQDRRNEELRRLYQLVLKRAPTAKEYGLDREGNTGAVGLKIAGQHQKELATGKQDEKNQFQAGLNDPARREQYRQLLRWFGTQFTNPGGRDPSQMSEADWQKLNRLEALDEVPVSFLNPSLTVRKEEVDTPEEATRYLSQHGGDTALNRQLLKAALDYGGLSIEPTPFGTLSRPGRGLEWVQKGNGPGEIESRFGNQANLTPQQLSAIAQERQGSFRLDDPKGLERMIAKAALAGTFATAGGIAGGAAFGPAIGGLSGGFFSPAVASGIGGGLTGGAFSSGIASGGDPNAIWKGALAGGVTGGLAPGLGSLVGPNPGVGLSALTGAGVGGAGNLVGQGLSGDFDWQKFLQALGTGAAGGAAAGLPGAFPGENILTKIGGGIGNTLLSRAGQDPLANANQQLDANALKNEQDRAQQLQDAQERWKAEFGARSAEAMAAQQEAFRAAQQEWESKKAEYEAKLQAFLDERQNQIQEALRAMGLAEPGIAGILAERQKQIDAAKQEQEAQRASLVESRNFFPSQLLETTGDSGASSLLVPHSPPPVLFGQEGLPASYQDYAQPGPPQFSQEGFLPSGSLNQGPPPSVAPMGQTRPPRYFPTLLNGLTRSPYLRYA